MDSVSAGFGIASHVGVLIDIPTVGVAKKLFHVDGLEKNEEHTKKVRRLRNISLYSCTQCDHYG